ncbi:unnamed protein product [Urochloa humidicola]
MMDLSHLYGLMPVLRSSNHENLQPRSWLGISGCISSTTKHTGRCRVRNSELRVPKSSFEFPQRFSARAC